MHIATKLLKAELKLLRPLLTREALELSRLSQDQAGALIKKRFMNFKHIDFDLFQASFAIPRRADSGSAILYLHGGGYTAGTLKYAEGFGSILAAKTGLKTLCPAYRLAPEHPYPAALEDAVTAYQYLLSSGISANRILLAGESAGGGLCCSLCLWLRDHDLPLPAGVVAISPWTDLTLSGDTLVDNPDGDPILTCQQIRFFRDCYAADHDPANPYMSPLLGDLTGLPDILLFAGGDELLLSDSRRMYQKLREAGVNATLYVQPEMWHGYILYGVEEAKIDYKRIVVFASLCIKQPPAKKPGSHRRNPLPFQNIIRRKLGPGKFKTAKETTT